MIFEPGNKLIDSDGQPFEDDALKYYLGFHEDHDLCSWEETATKIDTKDNDTPGN
jgi:hypothetical protein